MAREVLPSGGTTSFFGDIIDTIYKTHEHNAARLVNSIYEALVVGTPRGTGTGTPVDTGALKNNWAAGIRPNSKKFTEYKSGASVPLVIKLSKTYGIRYKYYIWNNSPYLEKVNAGVNSNDKANVGFVRKAIDKGIAKAMRE